MIRLKSVFLLQLTLFLSSLESACAQGLQGAPLQDSLKYALSLTMDDTSRIKLLLSLGNSYVGKDSALAFKYGLEGKRLSEQHSWQNGIGNYYLLAARIYYSNAINDSCLQNARKAYLILVNTTEKKNAAAALIYMANVYEATGFYEKSIENNLAALRLYESIPNPHGVASCYNNLGVAYYDLRQYDRAIGNYSIALGLRKTEGDKYGIGSDLDNIALVYLAKEKYDSADAYNRQAIVMFEAAGNKPGLGRIYANRGNILMKRHDAKKAYEYYRRSLSIDEEQGINEGLSYGNGFLGELYLDLAKDSASGYTVAPFMRKDKGTLLDSAEYYGGKALVWAQKAANIDLQMNHHLLLSEIEERQGHFQTALGSHKNYLKFKDSIFNDENKQKIAALESERLALTKDQEIALQTAEAKRQALLKKVILFAALITVVFLCLLALVYNKRRKNRFDKEVMEVEMKALRAQMNPHFISNALHSINRYVMENDRENASGYLSKFASLMRLILENSREQEVPLEQDLEALGLYMDLELLRFKNSFAYDIEVDPEVDVENTLVPPMLLQPFAENAILHGVQGKNNGMISIRVQKWNEMIRFVVEDNGNGGIDIASTATDEGRKRKSFGRKIIDERLSIINRLKKSKATVNIFQLKDPQNGNGGVRVELLLPIELAF